MLNIPGQDKKSASQSAEFGIESKTFLSDETSKMKHGRKGDTERKREQFLGTVFFTSTARCAQDVLY